MSTDMPLDPDRDGQFDPPRVIELLSVDASVPGAHELALLISNATNPGANFSLVRAERFTASLQGVQDSFARRGGPPGVVIGGDVDYLVGRLTEVPSDEVIIAGSVWDATGHSDGWEAQLYFRRRELTLLGFLVLRLGTLAGSGEATGS